MINVTQVMSRHGPIGVVRIKYATNPPLDQSKCNDIAMQVMDYLRSAYMSTGITNNPIVVIVEPNFPLPIYNEGIDPTPDYAKATQEKMLQEEMKKQDYFAKPKEKPKTLLL